MKQSPQRSKSGNDSGSRGAQARGKFKGRPGMSGGKGRRLLKSRLGRRAKAST
jgi:hypothetical protein